MSEPARGPVLLRADGSARIGMGHLVRGLALAAAVRRGGGSVLFATREEDPGAIGFLRGRGVEVLPLPPGADEVEDAAASLEAAARARAGVVVVDHYGLGRTWWRAVRESLPVLAVDDTGRPELAGEVDLVLNPNVPADYGETPSLCGPRYAMLRPEFLARGPGREPRERVGSILVTLGGADPKDATSLAVRGLAAVRGDFSVDVLLGPAFVHGDAVRRVAGKDPRVRVLGPLEDPSGLMARADLAVTGGGSTAYECAFLGLPSVMMEVAGNQAAICREMEAAGAAVALGPVEGLGAGEVSRAVTALLGDAGRLGEMSRAGARLLDGRGADRVAAALEALGRPGRTR